MFKSVNIDESIFSREALRETYKVSDRGSPLVRVNFISSADGAVTLDGRAGSLGSKNDQILLKLLRSLADVVVVGAGTVRAEGYGGINLHESDLAWRKSQGLSENPRMAIVSNSADLNPKMSFFTKAETRPIVITHASADTSELSEVADILIAGKDKVDVTRALHDLSELGLHQVLCEGGPSLFGAFLDSDKVDEVCLTISPTFVGGSAHRISSSTIEKDRRFTLESILHDSDSLLYLRYHKRV